MTGVWQRVRGVGGGAARCFAWVVALALALALVQLLVDFGVLSRLCEDEERGLGGGDGPVIQCISAPLSFRRVSPCACTVAPSPRPRNAPPRSAAPTALDLTAAYVTVVP